MICFQIFFLKKSFSRWYQRTFKIRNPVCILCLFKNWDQMVLEKINKTGNP